MNGVTEEMNIYAVIKMLKMINALIHSLQGEEEQKTFSKDTKESEKNQKKTVNGTNLYIKHHRSKKLKNFYFGVYLHF